MWPLPFFRCTCIAFPSVLYDVASPCTLPLLLQVYSYLPLLPEHPGFVISCPACSPRETTDYPVTRTYCLPWRTVRLGRQTPGSGSIGDCCARRRRQQSGMARSHAGRQARSPRRPAEAHARARGQAARDKLIELVLQAKQGKLAQGPRRPGWRADASGEEMMERASAMSWAHVPVRTGRAGGGVV